MAYTIVHFELDINWLEHLQHSHVFHIVCILAIKNSVQMQGGVRSNILQYKLTLKQNSCLVSIL